MLTYLIKKELKNIYKKSLKDLIKSLLNKLYIPSITSTITIVILMGLFFIASHFFSRETILIQADNHFQNLISIHAGIGVIIFALIIFIAESFRDVEGKDKALVLLKVSYLFPLVTAEILAFFIFIWGGINYWAIIMVVFIGFFTIFSLARTIRVLFSKHIFKIERDRLYIDRIHKSIDLAIVERIGNNILLNKINNNEIKLHNYMFSIENKSDYHCFNTEKRGIIADINLDKLKEFTDLVEVEANNNHFVFNEIDKKRFSDKIENSIIEKNKSEEFKVNTKRYLLKMFQDQINEENTTLICIEKSLISDTEQLKKLNSIFKDIFVIKNADSFTEEVRDELSGIKDQFINAILNKQLGKLEELISLYTAIAENFSKYMQKYGINFTFKQAQRESSSLFDGWKEIRWLSTDIKHIFKIAINSHDDEILLKVGYLLIAILNKSIDYNDHYLFQEFIRFIQILYSSSFQEDNPQLRDLMKDRSNRYLKNMADLKLEFKIRKEDLSKEEIVSLKDFVVYLFVIYQELLKMAYDKKDSINVFKKFSESLVNIFDNFHPSFSSNNSDDYKWQLKTFKHSKEREEEIVGLLHKQEFLEEIEKEINYRKMQMLYGLVSWLLIDYLEKKETPALKDYFKVIDDLIPTDLDKLTQIFLSTIEVEDERLWGWTFWEITEEDKVQFVDFSRKLVNFYCYKVLQSIATLEDNKIIQIDLPIQFNNTIFPSDGVINSLKKIEENKDFWKYVLTENAISKIPAFLNLLERIKKNIKEEEKIKLRINNISKRKIDTFKNEFKLGFYENSVVRNIFKFLNKYQETKDKFREDIPQFGLEELDEKGVFIEDWHTSYLDWGGAYGRRLALMENLKILESIEIKCIKMEEANLENILLKFTRNSDVIILTTPKIISSNFINTKNFKPEWHKDVKKLNLKSFKGYYSFNDNDIPVLSIYLGKDKEYIVIINKNKIGNLIQYSPFNIKNEKNTIIDIFKIEIQSFSENNELLNNFVIDNSKWLEKIGNTEAQENYLKEKVLISIFEKFEYISQGDFEGYSVKNINL